MILRKRAQIVDALLLEIHSLRTCIQGMDITPPIMDHGGVNKLYLFWCQKKNIKPVEPVDG